MPTLLELLPAVLSVTLTVALVAFFFAYAWGALDTSPVTAVPAAALDENAPGHLAAERAIGFAILSRLLTTAVLLGPLLLMMRRWRLPAGTATILFMTVSTLLFSLYEDAPPVLLLPPLVAGVVADLAAGRGAVDPRRPWTVHAFAGAVGLALWTTHFAALASTEGLGWTVELWGGAVVLAVLAAVGMALLAAPPSTAEPRAAPG